VGLWERADDRLASAVQPLAFHHAHSRARRWAIAHLLRLGVLVKNPDDPFLWNCKLPTTARCTAQSGRISVSCRVV
jgi:hypothetical protein